MIYRHHSIRLSINHHENNATLIFHLDCWAYKLELCYINYCLVSSHESRMTTYLLIIVRWQFDEGMIQKISTTDKNSQTCTIFVYLWMYEFLRYMHWLAKALERNWCFIYAYISLFLICAILWTIKGILTYDSAKRWLMKGWEKDAAPRGNREKVKTWHSSIRGNKLAAMIC